MPSFKRTNLTCMKARKFPGVLWTDSATRYSSLSQTRIMPGRISVDFIKAPLSSCWGAFNGFLVRSQPPKCFGANPRVLRVGLKLDFESLPAAGCDLSRCNPQFPLTPMSGGGGGGTIGFLARSPNDF